jgi:hypothetical protein
VQQTYKQDRSANREPGRLTKHKRTHNLHGTRKYGKAPHDPIALQEKPGEDPNSSQYGRSKQAWMHDKPGKLSTQHHRSSNAKQYIPFWFSI